MGPRRSARRREANPCGLRRRGRKLHRHRRQPTARWFRDACRRPELGRRDRFEIRPPPMLSPTSLTYLLVRSLPTRVFLLIEEPKLISSMIVLYREPPKSPRDIPEKTTCLSIYQNPSPPISSLTKVTARLLLGVSLKTPS